MIEISFKLQGNFIKYDHTPYIVYHHLFAWLPTFQNIHYSIRQTSYTSLQVLGIRKIFMIWCLKLEHKIVSKPYLISKKAEYHYNPINFIRVLWALLKG